MNPSPTVEPVDPEDASTAAQLAAAERRAELAAQEPNAAEHTAAHETGAPLSPSTMCRCGHTRLDHRGLRVEDTGPCLQCDCAQFARATAPPGTDEQVIARMQAGLDRLDRLQEVVARLRADGGGEVLDRQRWLALKRELCGEEFAKEPTPNSGGLQVRQSPTAMIVSIERLILCIGEKEALLALALGESPVKQWRVLWRGRLDTSPPGRAYEP